MAGFISWVFNSVTSNIVPIITGAREETTASESQNRTDTTASKNKNQETKTRQRPKKSNEEPSFSTHLTAPIESIIEETINDVLKPAVNKESKSSTKTKASASKETKLSTSAGSSGKSGTIRKSKEEPSVTVTTTEKVTKKTEPLKKEVKSTNTKPLDTKTQKKEPEEHLPEENQGISFFPVKEKRKSKPIKVPSEKKDSKEFVNEIITQGIRKKIDHSKPGIIEHFKKPAVQKKIVSSVEKNQDVVNVNIVYVEKSLLDTKQVEFKESKKVSTTVSYASVVTKDFTESQFTEQESKLSQKSETFESEEKEGNSASLLDLRGNQLTDQLSTQAKYLEKEGNFVNTNFAETQNTDFTNSQKTETFLNEKDAIANSDHTEKQLHDQEFTQFDKITVKSFQDFDSSVREDSNFISDYTLSRPADQEPILSNEQNSENVLESDSSVKEDTKFELDHVRNQLASQEAKQSDELTVKNFEQTEHTYTESHFDSSQIKKTDIRIAHTESEFADQESKQPDLTVQLLIKKFESGDIYSTKRKHKDSSSIEVISETTSETLNTDYQNVDLKDLSNISESFLKVESTSFDVSVAEEALEYSTRVSLNGISKELQDKELPEENIKEVTPQAVEERGFHVVNSAQDFTSDSTEENSTGQAATKQENSVEEADLFERLEENSTVDKQKESEDFILTGEEHIINREGLARELEGKVVFEDLSEEPVKEKIVFEDTEEPLIFESRYFADKTLQNSNNIEDTVIVDSLKDFIGQERESLFRETEDFKAEVHQPAEQRSAGLNSTTEEAQFELIPELTENPSLNLLQEESCSSLKNIQVEESYCQKEIFVNNFKESESKATELKSVEKKDLSSEVETETQQAFNFPYFKMSQIRILTLNDKEHQESTIYRIEQNWIIQFRLGPSLLGRKVNLYCNYPEENGGKLKEFDRCKYQLLSWCQDEGCKNADDTALFTQIEARLAGSFHYYFVYENGEIAERQGSGYFLVDPILKYGDNEDLPLDCIQCQTVLAKGLGPLSTWEKKLEVAKESGYNMIHFTPVQELGASNSSYSLSEQLKLNPVFNEEDNGKKPSFDDVEQLIGKLRKEWKVSSICDIVLNHTANESEWLNTHPEVTYNCKNCPYMRPAYLLDAAFHQFSMDVKKGLFEDRGIPSEVCSEEHLNAIRFHFKLSFLEPLKIHQMFTVNTEDLVSEFLDLARKSPPAPKNNQPIALDELQLLQDPEFRRLKTTVDINLALKTYNAYRSDSFDEDTRLRKCAEDFKRKLDDLNKKVIDVVNADLHVALENVIAGIRYFRVQADGPKFKDITINRPLVYRYFTDYGTPQDIEAHEEIMYSENGAFLMAHNGWVMNSDPLKNFADRDSNVYFRRELIAWGDSVKLRYGDSPVDCPFLWEHMRKYVELTAKIFDGVRLDNCHSTPLNVAEYLLDCARRVRPDLYVVAELFTNSDLTDNIFVNRLGITSLIREAMSAWDSHEEGRLVYRYGGVPVGSFYQPNIRPLVPTVAHALFLDLTHDNPSPVEKRSVFDMLPSTALVNMACCASGSNRGYDELVPHHIHVVDETRQYAEWTEDESLARGNARYVTKQFGIIAAKRAINNLHFKLGKEGFNQVYVDQMDSDIVAVTRHNPETHQSYVLVAYTAFGHPSKDSDKHQKLVKPLRVEGVLDEIVFEASLGHINAKSGGSKFTKFEDFVQDSKWINGLSEYQVTLKEHIQAEQSDILEKVNSGSANVTQLNFKNFKPGSVVVVKVSLPEDMKESVSKVRKLIKEEFSFSKTTELKQIVEKLKLSDLNRALYRCDQEERDEGFGFDVYNLPNFGPMVYAGLQGFMSLLAKIRPNNDLGHPMCGNLRDGNWMLEYIWKRLKLDEGTKELGQWIEENTKCFNTIPRYLVPCYFDVVVTGIYITLLEQSYKLMSGFVTHGSTFVKALSLGSLQFGAYIKSADLPALSPNLAPPKPPTRKNKNGEVVQACVSLSAGLPHFAVGYMRNWGRDTFIALRGLFILTGRYQEAREHILGYAACLRHGLIPNLLDGGRNSRFNCRDAVWWWLYCIKEYVQDAPNGVDILNDKVSRLFPKDDSPPQPPGTVEQTLAQVMQEALNVHFQGLAFRERNAGRQIDEHMTDKGFNNQIGVHPETGFVFGGNEWNCGTWMDKMGSSDKAGNRGKPATPRDGSAIELVGLSKSVITWLHRLHQSDKYPYNGVERTHKNGAVTRWTFKEWSDRIQENFEKYFWVNLQPTQDEVRPELINKRGIYKDSFGATHAWCDFQLRCNFPIAMVAAPELFNPQHAWKALENAEKHLLGPLGMKTLDPSDWNYRGDYDNSNDSGDASVAHGFNYHQGPEWVWPVGFFLRAKLLFAQQNGALKETLAETKVILSKHFVELQTSLWRGLPELTNSNGTYCRDSSRTQAWSMSCILEVLNLLWAKNMEVLHDLQQIESKQIVVN